MTISSETSNKPKAVAGGFSSEDGFVMDVRVLLALLTVTMAASFGAGFFWVPDSTTLALPSFVAPHLDHSTDIRKSQPTADYEDLRHPSGQHLLVDMKNIDSDFLDSEERLIEAMVQTIDEAGLTMLSYHCHALTPSGISCVGVLSESHISFHTWPFEGVITLDLFTCGSKPLLPVIKTVERLFGWPATAVEEVETNWAHELRGFDHSDEKSYLDDSSDLALMVLSPLDVYRKEHVYSNVTQYQRIDIWDVVDGDDMPTHQDGIKHNLQRGDPRWMSPELASPVRMLFLDGTLQSSSHSEHQYHEALVHPAMLAHPNPRRVAIIGGGEGATLREVLKHKTLESATMIEIDPVMVAVARQYLPHMSDCSDLIGRANNCFDDELANVVFQDAHSWFINRSGPNQPIQEPLLDVIIIDALDPEDSGPIADKLYTDVSFISSLVNSLASDGILLIQIGTPPFLNDPRPDKGIYWRREWLFNILEELPAVEAMMVYEEAHCGFNEPHAFLVVCRSADCRSNWYAESDAVDFFIYNRIVRTRSKERALIYYDGSLQHTYQATPKAWETVYCRREPMPFECSYRTLDPTKELHDFHLDNPDASSFRIVTSKDDGDDVTETRVYATVDIPVGSYIMPNHLASSLLVTNKTWTSLEANLQVDVAGRVAVIEDLVDFMDEFGHESSMDGAGLFIVEVGATYTIRMTDTAEEANVGRWVQPHPAGRKAKFSPVYDRHRHSFDLFMVATKPISSGEELLRHESLWNVKEDD